MFEKNFLNEELRQNHDCSMRLVLEGEGSNPSTVQSEGLVVTIIWACKQCTTTCPTIVKKGKTPEL
eukprot:2097363-Amphidinium_carterae.1